jgi:hypothetical protein
VGLYMTNTVVTIILILGSLHVYLIHCYVNENKIQNNLQNVVPLRRLLVPGFSWRSGIQLQFPCSCLIQKLV